MVLERCIGSVRLKVYLERVVIMEKRNDTTVSRHYNKCPFHPARFDSLEILVFQFMRSQADSRSGQIEHDREERRWIHRLAMVVPQGLNLME